MPVPTQTEMFKVVLHLAYKVNPLTRKVAKEKIYEQFNLANETEEFTRNGRPAYKSRIGWAISRLAGGGLLEQVARATYQITSAGRKAVEDDLTGQEISRIIRGNGAEQSHAEAEETTEIISPYEAIDNAEKEMEEVLSAELMQAIMEKEGREGDTFFEKIVTDLVAKMGYGEGYVTPASHDGGIDGVITADPLGFEKILVQAKRYSASHVVYWPEVGLFHSNPNGRKGVFITTSSFRSSVLTKIKDSGYSNLKLIDGGQLTKLMIKFGLGVSVIRNVSIKRVDLDYFTE